MSADTKQKFSKLTVILHWTVALIIIGLLVVGTYMEENEVYSLYDIHKSIGILIFAIILIRVIWRLKNGFPKPLGKAKAWEVTLSKIVHWVLLIGTILFPISGMMLSGLGGHGLPLFGMELVAPNYVDGQAVPINADLAKLGHQMHGALAKIMILAIILHVAGALKHVFVYKDGTLRRMLGGKIEAD